MNKHLYGLLLGIVVVFSHCSRPAPTQGQAAEYDKAVTILMHEPSEELFLGTLHPAAALFADYFNVDAAVAEHAAYRKELKRAGANVLTVREILLQGTIDGDGNAVEGVELDKLRAFASQFLDYNTSFIPEEAEVQQAYKNEVVGSMHPRDLVRLIMLQPEVILERTETNTGFRATYIERPIMNTFYMRDQMISTRNGVVIGRMNSVQRDTEILLVEFCLEKIGLSPIGRIEDDDAYLEGGDFLPFGRNAFIGCGMRTTQSAINQLMDNDWIGCDTLVVVKDRLWEQEQMHLDTYFNIIDYDLVTLSESRYFASPGSARYLAADIYVREDNTYRKVAEETSFVRYIEDELKVKVIPISRDDELTYACNYLTVAPRKIMAVAGQSGWLVETFAANEVEVTWVKLDNLIKGYGAAHCMTQVLGRKEVPQVRRKSTESSPIVLPHAQRDTMPEVPEVEVSRTILDTVPPKPEAARPVRIPESRPEPQSGEPVYHTIVRGDTLHKIAQQHGVTVEDICELNNITEDSIILAGSELRVK